MDRAWRLQILLLLAVAVFVAAVVAINWAAGAESWERVARLTDVTAHKPLYYEELELYLARSPDGLLALSARGPYEMEKVEFCLTSRLFHAPRSGSRFDRYGIYYGGPAPRSMTRFSVRVEEGIVYVQPQDPIEGPARGEVEALEPEGPLCLGA